MSESRRWVQFQRKNTLLQKKKENPKVKGIINDWSIDFSWILVYRDLYATAPRASAWSSTVSASDVESTVILRVSVIIVAIVRNSKTSVKKQSESH